jgi:hypothetical protein
MARVKIGFEESRRPASTKLVDSLVDELKSNRESGQPFIYEQQFDTGRIRVLVVWDAWMNIPLEDRTSTILAAYEKAGETDFRTRIALASGLTVPEAAVAGMLPYRVSPALRKSDPVTLEECRQAMLTEGGTSLMGRDHVELRVATEEQAEASVQRLVKKLPQSSEIWVITRDLEIPEFGPSDEVTMGARN